MISTYFELNDLQKSRFDSLPGLYHEWNEKINVISRKDSQHIEIHHILHSLAIAKVENFVSGSLVLDVGTGGGFPGIPLAILFPEVQFTLVDSIGKKIKVVEAISSSLGLENVLALHSRAEEVKGKFDFVVSRAVTRLEDFWPWVSHKFLSKSKGQNKNGLLYLKGGDISAELEALGKPSQIFKVSDFFNEEFFQTKLVVSVPA